MIFIELYRVHDKSSTANTRIHIYQQLHYQKEVAMFRKLSVAFISLFLLPVLLLAQDGKLRGKVSDKESGEPLIGANVVVEGTNLGASTDISGEYVILSVPPGSYSVKVSYIGYSPVTIANIRINSNITTTQDFQLSSTAIQVSAVEVVAERPLIQRNTTNTVRMTTQDDIRNIPVRGVANILSFNAGVVRQDGQLYIRGGRLGEVAFYVDGANVTNPYFLGENASGGSREGVSVIQEAIEEIQLQSGGYTAEFGGANSGIARTTTRTGGKEYRVTLDYQTDDFAKPGKKFLGTTAFGYRNVVGTAGGPLFPGSTFFLAGQLNYNRDRQRLFITPFRFDSLTTDGFYSYGAGKVFPGAVEFQENYLPGNWATNNSLQGTLLFDLNPIKLRLTGSYNAAQLKNGKGWTAGLANYFWQKEQLTDDNSTFFNLRGTHILNPTTFYEVGVSYYSHTAKTYDNDFGDDWALYADSSAARNKGYIIQDTLGGVPAGSGLSQFLGKTGWTNRRNGPRAFQTIYSFGFTHPFSPVNSYSKSVQKSIGVTMDFTSQVNSQWELKAGGRLESWVIRNYSLGDIGALMTFIDNSANKYAPESLAVYPSRVRERDVFYSNQGSINYYGYDILGNESDASPDGPRKPLFASAYIQNKFEFRDLVLNVGVRYEYFDQKVQTINNFVNPAWDNNLNYFANPDSQLSETNPASLLLPRISFSFPVTDRTVFYAMYGKYAQLPALNRLYSGSNYFAGRISPLTRVGYTLADNPAGAGFLVRPERTTQYEMGLRQTLSDNVAFTVSGFYKDIRDQIQIKRILNAVGVPIFAAYLNEDFGTIKGLELTLELRRTNRLSARLNYTMSDARGSASAANSSRVAVSDDGQARFPNFINPFDYNQTHRGSIFIDYRFAKGDGGWLEGFGANVILSFNSGHNYTKIQEPLNLGQASPWNIGVRALIDPRTRTPIEPINASSTPWVFNIDMNLSKVFYFGGVNFELYANILNLLNTKQVVNVFNNTGTPTDDGWLRSSLSESFRAIPNYESFYRAINLDNRWGYIVATGNDIYGSPRQIRIGAKVEL